MVGQPWLTNPTSVRKDTGSSAAPNTWRGTIHTSAGATPKRTQGIWFAIESTPEAPLTYTYSNGNTSVGCGANYKGEIEVTYHIVSGDDGLPLITNESGEIVPIATEVPYGIAQHGEYKFTYNADVDHQPLWRFDGWYWDEELTQRINPNQIFVITEDKDVYGTYYYYGSNLIDKQYLDVTGSVTAEPDDDTHVCTSSTYLVNKYDGTYHWQECAVCSTRYVAAGRPDDATTWENEYLEIKQNANGQRILAIRDSHVNHTYTSYWTMGDSCNENNKNVHTCTCGYSYKTDNTREHQSFTAKNDLQNYWYAEICDSCGYNRIRQRCEDASGVKINCGHLGTCALCGYTYTKKVHHPRVVGTIPNRIDDSNHPILVCDCGQITAEVMSLQIEHGTTIYLGPSIPEADTTRSQVTGTVVIKPATYQQPTAYEGLPYFDAGEITSNTTTWDQTSGQITQTLVARFDDATHIERTDSRVVFWYDVDVSTNEKIRYSFYQTVTPEVTPPTVSVTQNQTEFVNGWAINNSLTVSGTENYCSSVGIVMKDHETQDVIYSGTASVSGSFNPRLPREYSLVFSPDISASAGGRQFDITVTDPLGNSTTETVILYKVDNEAPAYNKDGQIRTVNEEDVWGTNNEWSKDKDFDVKFYDAGTYEAKAKIQNVTSTDTGLTFTDVFGISSVDESFLPPQYTRSYNFTGNLKGYSTILTQSEDGAGNKAADYFRVYNLDNTEPEISNAQYDGESTTIIKATLSDAHSGIRYFGIVPKGTGEISYPSNYPTSGTPSLLAASYNTWYEVSLIPANAEMDTPESGRDSIDVRFKIDEVGEYYLITEDYVGNRNYKLFNANREIIDESIEPVYIEKKYIDVTGAVTSTQTNDSHLCIDPDYIITKFDGTYHWNECKICSARYISAGRPEDGSAWENDYLEITHNSNGQRILAVKNSLTSHNYTTDYWTAGSANVCLETNKHIFVCNCGYSKSSIEGRRAHVPKEEYLHRWNMCYEECQNCTYSRKLHVCKDSSGNEINCDNWTVCAECGYDWSTSHPYHNMVFLDPTITNKDDESTLGDSGTRICWMCRKSFGGVNVTSGYNVITQGREVEVWTTWQLTPDTDSTYDSRYDDAWLSTNDAGLTITSTTSTKSGNYVTLRSRVTYPTTPRVETGKIYLKHRIWYKYNGVWVEDSVGHYEKDKDIYFVPETIAPTISSIIQNPISTYNDWARDTEIVVSGTENYCSSVNVVMKDHDTGEVIYKGSTSVNSGNYSLSFSPGLSASADGRQYDIIVSDTLKNSSSQSITITKMDNEDPSLDKTNQIVIMSGENIWGTEVEWSKDKDFDISFYDDGTDLAISKIQNVTSSKTGDTFIDSYGITPPENSSVTPTKYFRAYNFTGDVKGYVTLLESCKDAAGNKKEEYFRVYNLDNTNPEISGEQYDGDSTSMIKATLKDAHSGIKYFGIVPKESDTIAYPSAYPDGSVSTTSALDLNTWYQVPLIPANDIENTPESGQESVEVRLRALRRGTYYIITEDYVGNRNAKEFYAYKNNTDDNFELTFVEKQFLDVTGAITQTQSEHYHVCNDGEHLVQKYDGTYHWEECSICSKNYINAGRPNESDWENEFLEIKQNENGQNILVIKNSLEAHTYAQSYWLLGTNSCSDKNVHVMLCDCGYSYNDSSTKIKEHTWNMSTWESVDGFKHGHKCSSCGEYKDVARCYKTGGTLLGCDTRATGTCAVCGNNRNNLRHRFNVSEGFEEVMTDIKCLICNAVICSRRTYTVAPTATPGVLRLTIVYELPAAYSAIGTHDDKFMVGQSSSMYGEVVGTSTRSVSADHKTVTMSGNYRYTTDAYSRVLKVGIGFYFTRAADNTETYLNTFIPVPKEINAPVISNISQDIIAQYNGWATNTNITISGTEDYCPLVTIEMKDHDTGAVVYSTTADVTGGNYSISFIPDVYADATGKEYDITVTDTIGNSSTQTIVITKFDREPPTFVKTGQLQIIDGEEVWGTEVPWSKSKDFTITMYDNGSDTVEAEIQDVISVKTDELFEDEYGTTAVDDAYNPRYYTREYQFTGDVKGYVTIRTDGRDMARNHSSDYFRVYNLDNTDPVIESVMNDIENQDLYNVTLSDAHSGIKYFGIVEDNAGSFEYPTNTPNTPTLLATNVGEWYQVPLVAANASANTPESGQENIEVKLRVVQNGIYHVIVEDYVGNRNSLTFEANIDSGFVYTYIPKKTVDVTGAVTETQETSSHVCNDAEHLVSKFDGTYHWQECSVCSSQYVKAGRPSDSTSWENEYLEIVQNGNGQNVLAIKNSLSTHSYTTDYWTMGDSCSSQNKHLFICSCGFSRSEDNTREHIGDFSESHIAHLYTYAKKCNYCGESVERHDCINDQGIRITCCSPGSRKCVLCPDGGWTYTVTHLARDTVNVYEANAVHDIPLYCQYEYIDENNTGPIYATANNTSINHNVNGCDIEATAEFTHIGNYAPVGSSSYCNDLNKVSLDIAFNESTYKTNERYRGNWKSGHMEESSNFAFLHSYRISASEVVTTGITVRIRAEEIPPTIDSINQTMISSNNGWSTNNRITVSGTENYCYSVKVKMEDAETGEEVYSASIPVESNNYSYSFTPDVSAGVSGKQYRIIVSDTLENSTSQIITITKADNEPPEYNKSGQTQTEGGETRWGTTIPWSKTKDFTIKAIDEGTDFVEMKLQDVTSTNTGDTFTDSYGITAKDSEVTPTEYTRDYEFVGNVKGYVTLKMSAKDYADNSIEEFFRVYNLDNTLPVIDPNPIIDTENNTITVKVSDAHSGVRYFGFLYYEMENVEYPSSYPSDSTMTASSPGSWYQVPLIPANSATNEPESGIASGDVILNYETSGRYYIIVEDYVGNRNYAELLIGNDYAIPPVMSSYSGDYDGEPHHVTLEDSGNGGTLQYSLDGENWTNGSPETVTRTNAGVTTVYARIKGDSSHDDSDIEIAEIRINKLFLDAPDMQGFMGAYDGVPHHVTLLSAGSAGNGGTLQYSLDGETWTDGSPETVTRTALGTTTVYARVKGDENHEDSSIVSADITIAQFDYNIIEKKTVNVTGSTTEPAIASTHNCNDYSVPKYDDRYHWNECSICSSNYVLASRPEDPTGFITDYTEIKTNNAGKRILVIKDSFVAHTYTSSWSLTGTNKCSPSNKYYRTCNCGYSYNDTSVQNTYSHNWVAKINVSKTSHATRCSNCNTIKAGTEERHKNSSGQTIGCDTGVYGSCAICPGGITGHTFNNDTNWQTTSSIDLKCILCNRKLGTRTYSISRASNGVITFTEKYVLVDAFKPTNGVTQYRLDGGGASMITITQDPTCSVSSDKRTVTLSTKFKFNAYYETSAALALIIYCKDSSNRTNYLAAYVHISPDVTAPTISQVTQTNVVQSNGWEVNSNISITGTENYSNRVYITMEDTSNSTRVYSGAANVSSGNYSLNFAPDYLDAPDSGRTYTIRVQDVFGNTTTRNITITKHDGTKPEYLKSDQLSEYDGEIAWGTTIPWSKTKDFIAKARDLGTNFTEIKLQNVTNTDNGATFVDEYGITTYSTLNPIEYTREYEFVGNVRGYITMKIDAKDQANNILSDYFRIYNLDNTNPEVDPSYVENGDDKQIEATLLDSLSGIKYFGLVPNANGVAIYPTTYNNTPTTVATDINQWYQAPLTAENTTTKEPEHGHESLGVSLKIPANGNYFIVVEDYVGNRSSFGITMTALDETPPHGTIVLKDPLISIDALEGVKENYATLLINATDDEGTVEYMALANEDNRTTINWIEYDTEIDWTLSSEDGYKVVYVMFKDDSGNVSVSFGP